MLDQPWKIGFLIVALVVLRAIWGVWPKAPGRKAMIELLDSGLIAVVLVFVLVRPFVVQAFYIPTGSMEPNLQPQDRILVNKFVYRLNPVKRGDIVVFRAPEEAAGPGQQRDFVKRVIGLPGDQIGIETGVGVYVNGQLLSDPPGVPAPNYSWP
ncbi:MAG: signal peptidase I, partial [Armatimonadetes bacterium]|nr:signal peptidase I [Armatimonadota bacterium]